MDDIKQLAILIFTSGAIFSFLQFLIQRYDNRKGVEKQLVELHTEIDSKIDEVNKNVDNRIDEVNKNVDALSDKVDENQAILARTHILRFADDLKNGISHSEEYFEQQLDDIKTYNMYCDTHKDFKNERTVLSSEYIKKRYSAEVLESQDGN